MMEYGDQIRIVTSCSEAYHASHASLRSYRLLYLFEASARGTREKVHRVVAGTTYARPCTL